MLIGRTQELAGVDALVAGAAAGRGGIAVICGEAGIGKTRLADEVAARASERGFRVLWGRAWESGGAPAYYPWIEMLQELRALEPELPPRLHALLQDRSVAPGESTIADVERERFELFDSVTSYLRAAARSCALLLVFDDLHAADLASLELLSFVAHALRGTRIAAIATYRDVEARLPPRADAIARIGREGEVIVLRPLSAEEVGELVRHALGRFDAALSAQLHELTEGNPLFLRETLYTVAAKDASQVDLRELAVTDGLLSLLADRLRRTRPETRTQLEVAAVVGREVEVALCAEVTGVAPAAVANALEEAVVRGLLARFGEHRFRFTHVLVREAVYRALAADRRRELHARVAERLHERVRAGREAFLAPQAHHALAALPVGDPEAAMRAARLAADQARSRLAYEEATELLERALSTCDALDLPAQSRVEVLLALGWTRTEAGRLEQGRDVFREATRIARGLGDASLLARAALGQGGEYVLSEIRGELVGVLREALDQLRPDREEHARLRARVLARLAAAITPSASPEEPLALAREALAMTRDESDTRVRIDVDVGVGAAFADFAPPQERIPVNERLLSDATALHDRVLMLRALTRLACDHLERADVVRADSVIAARASLAKQVGRPRYQWQGPLLSSMRWMAEGRFADCEAAIAEAREYAASSLDPNAQRCIEVHRISLLMLAGRIEGRAEQEQAALRTFAPLPHASPMSGWLVSLGYARAGELERARQALAPSATFSDSHVMTARMARVWSSLPAVAVGDRELCERLYASFDPNEDSNACWGPFGMVCWPPISHYLGLLAGALGRSELAIAHAERALRVCERMPAPAHQAWVELGFAEALGCIPAARAHYERALSLAQALDMPEVLSAAERGLNALPAADGGGSTRPALEPSAIPEFSLREDGNHWSITHAGRSFQLKPMRGLKMLARLCERPGTEVHALDLVADFIGAGGAGGEGGAAADRGDSGDALDPQARAAYKRRIDALRGEVDEAERFHDPTRANRAREELDALTQQLSAAFGLGGRARHTGSAAERARVSVQRRLREAIRKIAEQDPELGRHLDWTIRTGLFCAYEPAGRVG